MQCLVRQLTAEPGKQMKFKLDIVSYVSKVWEDNTGAQKLANSKGHIMTTRTKKIGIRYHWFRLMINPTKIEIVYIDKGIKGRQFYERSDMVNFEHISKRRMEWLATQYMNS